MLVVGQPAVARTKADGELKAAVNLIRNRVAVDPAKLSDESVDLRRLVPER